MPKPFPFLQSQWVINTTCLIMAPAANVLPFTDDGNTKLVCVPCISIHYSFLLALASCRVLIGAALRRQDRQVRLECRYGACSIQSHACPLASNWWLHPRLQSSTARNCLTRLTTSSRCAHILTTKRLCVISEATLTLGRESGSARVDHHGLQ